MLKNVTNTFLITKSNLKEIKAKIFTFQLSNKIKCKYIWFLQTDGKELAIKKATWTPYSNCAIKSIFYRLLEWINIINVIATVECYNIFEEIF